MRLLLLAAVMAGSIVGLGAGPAHADLCVRVWSYGIYSGGHNVGACEPVPDLGTYCDSEDVGDDPAFHYYESVCVPSPVVATP